MRVNEDVYALWAKRIFGALLALILLIILVKTARFIASRFGQVQRVYHGVEQLEP